MAAFLPSGRIARAGNNYKRAPAGPSIEGSPKVQPVYTALPGSWTPTVKVRGFPTVEWCVFQVSEDGRFTTDMTPVSVSAPAGTASGAEWTFQPAAVIKGPRDRVIVKNTFNWPAPEGTKEWVSDGAVVNLPAPVATGGFAHAQRFRSNLTIGLNVERGAPHWNGYMTTGRYQSYKDLGFTHVRLVGPYGPWSNDWPDVAGGGMDYLFESGERAMSVGLYLLIDVIDMIYPHQYGDERIMQHIRACAKRVAGRKWDTEKYAIGAMQEYAGGNNAEHKPHMDEAVRNIRAELPNSLILVASALWNDPGALLGDNTWNGEMGEFIPPPDDRILVQWHKYDSAADLGTSQNWQRRLAALEADKGFTIICGEYAMGPPDGGESIGRPGVVADQDYLDWPGVFHATSRGMGPQRPTYWTACGEPNSWWRMNKPGTAELHDAIKPLATEADTYIRAQSWFQPIAPGSAPASVPAGTAAVTKIQVLHRGQSNAYFGDSSGAAEMLRATFQSLAGVPVEMVSRRETADDSTLHSATYTYWNGPNGGRWLAPPGNDYGSDPSGWTAEDPMAHLLNAVSRHVSSDSSVPLYDFPVHWEYDLAMNTDAARNAYPNGSWEPARRMRAARTKAPGKHVQLRGYCPYGYNWNALDEIRASWMADFGIAARNVIKACGNMLDASHRGDDAHWTDESAQRIYPRVAFMAAVHAFRRGWLPSTVDLSDCPSEGPWISGGSVSGNSVTISIGHDKGTAIVAPADPAAWNAFTCTPGETHHDAMEASGGAILSGTSVRVDFPSAPPAGGRIWHCAHPGYYGRGLLRDNWHAIRPAKYAGVPNIAAVEFPLQRTLSPTAY